MDWIKMRIPRLSLFVLITFAILFFADILLRQSSLAFRFLPPLEPKGYVRFDGGIGYDITPSFPLTEQKFADLSYNVWSNALGCFDNEYDGTSPYIYLTGDSFAWGWAPLSEKWGKGIERYLGIRVLTCGVNGYGTKQEYIKTARDMRRLPDPALIIVGYLGANDADDDALFPHYTVENGRRVSIYGTCELSAQEILEGGVCAREQHGSLLARVRSVLGANSVLYNAAYRTYIGLRSRSSTRANISASPLVASDMHKENIRQFSILAAEHNTRVLFVLIPSKTEITYAKKAQTVYGDIISFLDREHIAYIDLFPIFSEIGSETPLYWSHDGHWNVEGNRLAGLAVSCRIVSVMEVGAQQKNTLFSVLTDAFERQFSNVSSERRTMFNDGCRKGFL